MLQYHEPRMSNQGDFRRLEQAATGTRAGDVRRLRSQHAERSKGDPPADESAVALVAQREWLTAPETRRPLVEEVPEAAEWYSATWVGILADATLTPDERLRLAEGLFVHDAERLIPVRSAAASRGPIRTADRSVVHFPARVAAVAAGVLLVLWSARGLKRVRAR